MKEKSVNQITVKELVEEVDINRSTFYLHFKDIQDLLREIEENMEAQDVRSGIKWPITSGSSFMTRRCWRRAAKESGICRSCLKRMMRNQPAVSCILW